MRRRTRAQLCAGLVSALAGWSCVSTSLCAQTPKTTEKKPAVETPSPNATPPPQATPFSVPSAPGPTPAAGASPSVATPSSVPLAPQATQVSSPLTLDEALRLANAQASSFQQATLNERIAAEDVRQAQAAFLPKVSAPLNYIYTTPLIGSKPGTPREQSFIANNAISEYQAFVNVAGDIDIAGKLRATLAKNRALLEAAHAGTDVARRALVQAVIEAYYGLALAAAQRSSAEQNLAAALEFERITSLLVSGGEVAPVDLTRAQLQTLERRDEFERALANEVVAAGSLRILVGYDFTRPISTADLMMGVPVDPGLQQFRPEDISRRPEFA